MDQLHLMLRDIFLLLTFQDVFESVLKFVVGIFSRLQNLVFFYLFFSLSILGLFVHDWLSLLLVVGIVVPRL